MAVIIKTTDAATLLAEIRSAVIKEKIPTWSWDSNEQFWHDTKSQEWKDTASFRGSLKSGENGELRFGIIPFQNKKISRPLYAALHGRFIEMLLSHFSGKLDYVFATSKVTDPDTPNCIER